jgi:hypothetical protein
MQKPKEHPAQDLQQIWFAGVHSDIGGGYADSKLWRCAFDWMIAEGRTAGLMIEEDQLATVAPTLAEPWKEMQHESLQKWWKIAEFFPKLHWNGTKNEIRCNLFGTRKLAEGELLHGSVLERIRNKDDYKPGNLSKAFRKYVQGLSTVPDVMAYSESPLAATAPPVEQRA